jgi:hypothetical protein
VSELSFDLAQIGALGWPPVDEEIQFEFGLLQLVDIERDH